MWLNMCRMKRHNRVSSSFFFVSILAAALLVGGINTYAAELQQAIIQYEPRLQDVKVSMTYIREEKTIYTTVDALISTTQEPYQFTTTIKVWR